MIMHRQICYHNFKNLRPYNHKKKYTETKLCRNNNPELWLNINRFTKDSYETLSLRIHSNSSTDRKHLERRVRVGPIHKARWVSQLTCWTAWASGPSGLSNPASVSLLTVTCVTVRIPLTSFLSDLVRVFGFVLLLNSHDNHECHDRLEYFQTWWILVTI